VIELPLTRFPQALITAPFESRHVNVMLPEWVKRPPKVVQLLKVRVRTPLEQLPSVEAVRHEEPPPGGRMSAMAEGIRHSLQDLVRTGIGANAKDPPLVDSSIDFIASLSALPTSARSEAASRSFPQPVRSSVDTSNPERILLETERVNLI
jgi:hypothetical protein